jgi:hypothetical protein
LGYTGLVEKSYFHIKWLPLHKGQTINSTTKFYGPFRIIEILVIVACKLQLPANVGIHLLFHVGQLKKSSG